MYAIRSYYVTGHNISNLNTTGYVRQQAMMGDSRYATDATGRIQIGTGVDVAQIRQIRQSFLDNIYRAENNGLQYWETRSKALGDLETIIRITSYNVCYTKLLRLPLGFAGILLVVLVSI